MKFLILSLRGIIRTTCLSGLIIPEEWRGFKERVLRGEKKDDKLKKDEGQGMIKLEIIERNGKEYA
jgi:hypothetical protein